VGEEGRLILPCVAYKAKRKAGLGEAEGEEVGILGLPVVKGRLPNFTLHIGD